jgi:uncharacterized protein
VNTRVVTSFLVGALFAVGLGISGMTMPARVRGFLDFTGAWDPTLLFVMGGAVMVYFLFFRFFRIWAGGAPVLGGDYSLPSRRDIDLRLLGGAGLFGVGWGLAGFCPGPAITAAGGGLLGAAVFVGAMIAGMALFEVYDRR